jgi:hypothetical protein
MRSGGDLADTTVRPRARFLSYLFHSGPAVAARGVGIIFP